MQRSTWKTRGNEYGAFTRNETNVTSYYQQQPRRQMNRYAPYQKPIQGYPSEGPTKISNVTFQSNVHSSSIGELIGQTDLSPGQSRISCLPSDLKTVKDTIASIQGAAYHLPADLQHGVVADVLEKRIRHRERSRINQARYRERQKQVETKIGDAIVKLISEIEDLETKCKYYVYFSPTPTRWALASEYFRQLNNYLSSPVRLIKLSSKFLREVLAPDVMDGSRFGVDAQLENWILFVLYFDNVCVDLKSLKRPSPDTVVASTVTSVTITSKTLRRVFPHLNSDGVSGTKGGVWSPLAARLLGKNLVMHGSVSFGWDRATDKVASLYSQADMLRPMLNLLGSLEDVSRAFYKARVTPDFRYFLKE